MFLTFLSYVMTYVPLREFLRILEYMGHFSEVVLNGKILCLKVKTEENIIIAVKANN